jgi:hypothetical protein
MTAFYEILEETSKFSLEEQESIVDIIQKIIADEKRKRLISEVNESIIEFELGNKLTSSIEDILKEIQS